MTCDPCGDVGLLAGLAPWRRVRAPAEPTGLLYLLVTIERRSPLEDQVLEKEQDNSGEEGACQSRLIFWRRRRGIALGTGGASIYGWVLPLRGPEGDGLIARTCSWTELFLS